MRKTDVLKMRKKDVLKMRKKELLKVHKKVFLQRRKVKPFKCVNKSPKQGRTEGKYQS